MNSQAEKEAVEENHINDIETATLAGGVAKNNHDQQGEAERDEEREKDADRHHHRYPTTLTATRTSPSRPQLPIAKPATKPPKQTLLAVYDAGVYKAGLTLDVLAVQSVMAGIYIALAGHLYLSVGGGILGASLFPTGLLGVILTSAELFTGDALVFVASVLGGQVHMRYLLRNWIVSWIFNFVGALTWAFLLVYLSDALEDQGRSDFAIQVAVKKINQSFLQTFLKAIGANFLVCVGVWQAICAEEVAGKVLALWFPITAFVSMGLDHCIANQFFLPLGLMLGAPSLDEYNVSSVLCCNSSRQHWAIS